MEQDTIFGKIVRGEIPCDKVFEDELVLAFRDINPAAPTHILVIPKKPIASLDKASPEDKNLLGHMLLSVAQIARDQGVAQDGYRVAININEQGGQTVYHLHMHLLAGRGLSWPPG